MIKNILQNAESIKNDHTCLYDTNYGYNCTFTTNGDVEGWDIYDNIYLYGCWNKALFGTSNTTTCYIGRTENIFPVVAEDYSIFRMMLKITAPENPYKSPPTTGNLQWKTSADDSWDDDKLAYFSLKSTETWFLVELALDEHQYWSNNITALRVTLFEEGYEGISFAIRYIRLASTTHFKCLNTQCSYYPYYSHPCQGAGEFSSVTANVGFVSYTTVSGISDTLVVNIDDYGDECIHLGSNEHISGVDMAKVIARSLNHVDVGSYAYATVEHTEDNKLKIVSGNLIANTSVVPIDIVSEFGIYVYAYDVSDNFKALLTDAELYYCNPIKYLYIIYGDFLPFLEIVYKNFITTNNSYYTVAGSFSTLLSTQSYFTDILATYFSNDINITSICDCIYDYGYIDITYPSTTDLYIVSGMLSSTAYFSIYDVSNDKYLVENYSDEGVVFSTKVTTKKLRITSSNRQVLNHIIVNNDSSVVPTVFASVPYGFLSASSSVGEINTAWLQNTFDHVVTSADSVAGSNIIISGGTAAEALGFYTDGMSSYTQKAGTQPATGFEYASVRRLRYFEIDRLINNDFRSLGYFHNPTQPAVDAGRHDYYESLSANTKSVSHSADYYKKLDGADKIIIDFTHPISDCGRLNNIKIGGSVSKSMIGSVLILRPYKDGTLVCIDEFIIEEETTTSVYSSNVTTNYISFNVFVSKGDLIGFKNIDLLCPFSSKTQTPNATLCILPTTVNTANKFDPGDLFSVGVIGPSYYAYSNLSQNTLKLEIDLGKRFNVNKFQVYGKEYGDYFEYNLAACLDVDWKCNLFDEYHTHHVINDSSLLSYYVEHLNVAYGLDSLCDCSVTADSGKEGTSFDSYQGLATYGKHTYFYVNGDAEWLNGGSYSNGRCEFSYPYHSQEPVAYQNDPVMLYITIPEDKSVNIHRTTIYFKESPNFKKMGIARYLGPNSIEGNTAVAGYQYIENITSVSLDGVSHYPDDGDEWTVSKFVTTNPLPDSQLALVDNVITNSDLYLISGNTEWNVFDYNYESVEAYGFMLYSDWHKSTKIIEIEVYSRFEIKPTLIDNITVQTSVYGNTWDMLIFENDPDDDTLISAFVSASPRYFKLSIEPQDLFDMYELSLSLDESGKGSIDCIDSLIPTTARMGELSSVSVVELENIYDVPLHMYVNIPKNLISTSNLLSWIKLSSEESTAFGEVGPGAILQKNSTYPLTAYNNQIAINCPSYYLNNLIEGKSSYTYDYNSVWQFFNTLHTGEEINYTNLPNAYVANLNFDQVASRYWKVLFGDADTKVVNAVKLLNGDTQINIESVYMQAATGSSSSYKIPITFNDDGAIQNTSVFKYAFLDNDYLDTWTPTLSSGSSFLSTYDSGLYPTCMAPGALGRFTAAINNPCNSFKAVFDFKYLPHSCLLSYSFTVELQDNENNPIVYVTLSTALDAITMAAYSYDPDSIYDNTATAAADNSYGSATISRSTLASSNNGELRIVLEKVSKTLNYIKLTSRDELTTFITLTPTRTYFSSRVYNLAVVLYNPSNIYLPVGTPVEKTVYSNIRTLVFDCTGSYGSTSIGLRSVELFDMYGQRILFTTGAGITAYASSIYSGYYVPGNVFNTSLSKTGTAVNTTWYSSSGVTNARLICTFKQPLSFSEIVINNYHHVGTETAAGVKNVKIYVSTDNYTNTTYEADISNSSLIYDGVLKAHVSSDVEDNEFILLGGEGSSIISHTLANKPIFGVDSIELLATPYISNFESLIFEFDSVTALDCIQIATTTDVINQAAVMITDSSDGVYETWARNTSKIRMTNITDSTFVASGYIYYVYQYRGYGYMYPYWSVYRDTSYAHVWIDTGNLPLWIAYDFGEGNECEINSLSVEFRGATYDALPQLVSVVEVYGSNDSSIDWSTKPKDLLATVSGSLTIGDKLRLELNTVIPYRYYCLYAPNLTGSTEDYTLAFKEWCMYSHIDPVKRDYKGYAINNSLTTHSLNTIITDLYWDVGNYKYAAGGQPHYLFDLRSKQPVSGIKLKLDYINSFISYGYLEYSSNSTNGLDGDWTTVGSLNKLVASYTSSNTIVYYVYNFSTVYATWLRIYMSSPTTTIYTTIYEFVPILGELSSTLTINREAYNNYFVVDLGDIYYLDFIRNYGDSDDLLDLFSVDIEISEDAVDNVANVVWDSYIINSKTNARWLKFPLICGTGTDLLLQYLGIYPDIAVAYKKNGGYNCEWTSIGVGLSDYSYSINVAPQATIYSGNLDILNNVKTIVIDIHSNYSGDFVILTALELYDLDGDIIQLSYNVNYVEDNCIVYASNGTSPENIFNTNNTNVGIYSQSSWYSTTYVNKNIRIVCVLDTPVALSKIAIQNGHASGTYTYLGVELATIMLFSDVVTSTTFGDVTSDESLTVFCGTIPKHIGVDVEDRYIIDLVNITPITNNYFGTYPPVRCIQGDATLTGFSNSWGFMPISSEVLYPTLELKLDMVYIIQTFKLTHAIEDDDYSFINVSYKIYGKHLLTDSYTELFYITNNSELYREHVLDVPVLLQYVKLEILDFTSDDDYYYYDVETGNPILIEGGFLREFEIWTNEGSILLNSEEHPVVCMNLREAQIITAHELINLKEEAYNITTLNWDNSEEFFSYSDNIFDDPQKVSFSSSSGNTTVYSTGSSYLDYTALEVSIYIGGSIYLAEGSYRLDWQSFNALYNNAISLTMKGPETIRCINNNISSGWFSQLNYFSIEFAGYYNIYVERMCEYVGTWGAKVISIIKAVSNTKWISVKRDTATNHAWSEDSDDYGIDYLNRIRVYAATTYMPTEFPWFWSSTISTLSREHANVKEGRYALKIDYPTSSGVDRVDFLEGDHFGWDQDWSVKDTLSFWWYISDLDNLYIDEGGFGFGSFSGGDSVSFVDRAGEEHNITSVAAYYLWDFKYMDLQTGWNEVKLQFDRNTCTAPLQSTTTGLLENELNFRENYFKSFGIVYKGVGAPFYMLFDGLKIERNYYNDVVKDDHGLCLTWNEYAEIPLSGITLYRGTIEFWIKPYTATNGRDIFGNTKSRVLFTLTNNYNELICLTIKSAGWFEIGFGGARYDFNVMTLDPTDYNLNEFSFAIDEPFHIAVAWSSFGKDMDNSDTLRLFVNDTLLISSQTTWDVSDTKSSLLRLGGGSTILANNNDEEGSAIFSHVKVYDYCKTSFPLGTHEPETIITAQANAPIQVSKDGVSFHDYNSDDLPLKYESVGPGEKVKIYTRIDKSIKQRASDSGTLEIDWEVIV